MNIWLAAIPLSIVGAWAYRRGGTNAGTLWRDVGLPSCVIAFFLLTGNWHWILVLCFGLTFAAQTTYFKKKGTDAEWYNWLFVGLAFSFSLLPYSLVVGHMAGFLARSVIVTAFTTLWSEVWGIDFIEEYGRGWVQVITLPLLVI